MFSLFNKKKVTADLSFLGADMHSHLLPALDDGLKTMEETIAFIRQLHELGYSKLICTPHIISDLYPNSPDTILPSLQEVQKQVAEHNIPVQIEAAAEYMVDMDFEEWIRRDRQLLTFGENYILIEMSFVAASPNIETVIFELCIRGLQPIIAHPERYVYFHDSFDKYQRLIDLGCILQVNMLSLLGYYGGYVKKAAEKLLKNNMIQFAGTDMHHDRHLEALIDLASKKEMYDLLGNANLRNKSLV
jgi:protein-tyrosine phosphatase